MLDYITQRCKEIQEEIEAKHSLPFYPLKVSPLNTFHASSIQIGDYHAGIDDTGFLRFYQCILNPNMIHEEDQRTYRLMKCSLELSERIWNFLSTRYGQAIIPGLYPCDDTEIIQSAEIENFKGKRRKRTWKRPSTLPC